MPKVKDLLLEPNKENLKEADDSGNRNSITKWLFENSKDLINEFGGSSLNKSNRIHKKLTYVTNRLNELVELRLLVLNKSERVSERNKDMMTDIYRITEHGSRNALLLDLQNYDRNSPGYKKIIKYLLRKSLEYIPDRYKDDHNHYYYLMKSVLENCIENYVDTILYFNRLMGQYKSNYYINFFDIRSDINYAFYIKIITDNSFKNLFYKILETINLDHINKSNINLNEDTKNDQHNMIKYQFKLDIENHIERDITFHIKEEKHIIETFNIDVKPTQFLLMKGVLNIKHYTDILKAVVLNFDNLNKWEQLRNTNLSKFNIITILVKCNSCNQIYPYSFEIEKESYDQLVCIYCNNNIISI
jgi:hypothetical protein